LSSEKVSSQKSIIKEYQDINVQSLIFIEVNIKGNNLVILITPVYLFISSNEWIGSGNCL